MGGKGCLRVIMSDGKYFTWMCDGNSVRSQGCTFILAFGSQQRVSLWLVAGVQDPLQHRCLESMMQQGLHRKEMTFSVSFVGTDMIQISA